MIFTLIVRLNVMFYRQTVCNHMSEGPNIAKHCHHNRQITQHDAVFCLFSENNLPFPAVRRQI